MERYDKLKTEYNGFCPVALLSGGEVQNEFMTTYIVGLYFGLGGFLLPGNCQLGTLRWKGRLYLCSTVDRAEQFGCEPDLFIQGVTALIHRHSVLEQLLVGDREGLTKEEERSA